MITDGGGSAKAIGERHNAPGVECAVERPLTEEYLGYLSGSCFRGEVVERDAGVTGVINPPKVDPNQCRLRGPPQTQLLQVERIG
jgi:hypothetical protein